MVCSAQFLRSATVLALAGCVAEPPAQPTDPLTAAEITTIGDTLRGRGHLGENTVLTFLALRDPDKPDGMAETAVVQRQAEAQVFDRGRGSLLDLVLDLPAGRVVSEHRREGVVPRLSNRDGQVGARLLRTDPAWLAALERRGLGPVDVSVSMVGPGVLGEGWEVPSHRYARFLPSLRAERTFVATPVEGVVGIVDLTDERVVSVTDAEPDPPPLDRGHVPLFPGDLPLPEALRTEQRRPNYQVRGTTVTWAGWSFRFAMDAREGLVLHDVAFGPPGQGPRRILSRASLAEMLVPYGDPSAAWTFRTIFDAGEFGIGRTAASLRPGQDLPDHAKRFDAVIADEGGRPQLLEGVIGLHERDGGLRWRHAGQAQRSRELVIRSATTVGNYDYGFSWVFSQDGVLAMEIDLTGQMLVKGVRHADPRFGTLVAPHLSAILHQHFFSFRLDFDVDGRRNRVREIEGASLAMDSANPHGAAFAVRSTVLRREGEGVRDAAPERSRMWVVENPHRRDSLGQSPGYLIVPGPLPALLGDPQSLLRRRGAFATRALWVTARRPDERYSAGEFPGQDPGGAGLPAFMANDEAIDDTDLVVWYTTGLSHLPTPEEWPLMPVSRIRFELRPRHFRTMTAPAGAVP